MLKSLAISISLVAALGAQHADVDPVLARVSDYVAEYYARAQSLLVEETVIMQPLSSNWTTEGFPRRLLYEVRVEWDPASDEPVTAIRKLIRATGPAFGSPDQPDCMDPRSISPEPMAFLLPGRRDAFTFALAGQGRTDGRRALMLDYRPIKLRAPKVEWHGECAHIELSGHTQGRIWADTDTSAILRLDEHLIGLVDIPGRRDRRPRGAQWFTVERADTSIRYTQVRFENPDEILVVPQRIDTLNVIRNSGIPRLRIVQTYANYRRFVTDTRIVE